MGHHVQGVITEVLNERAGLQRVMLQRAGRDHSERAFVVTALTGTVAAGDEVLANVTAVDLGLGTGGWHIISANLTRGEFTTPSGGHILKLRYTPVQVDTGATAEHLEDLPSDLHGATVVACTLHSQVPLVVLGARSVDPNLRIAYVMTDGAALPLAFSGLVAEMTDRDLLAAGTITAGHAFGGMREAVGVPDALALARHDADADLIVVGMGPGVVGTGQRLGTTALEAAPILDTAEALGARGVLCVRASEGDARSRHHGLSHHSATVLDLVRSSVTVPVVAGLADQVRRWERHRIVEVPDVDAPALLDEANLTVTTMGRGPDDDRLFFDTAAAAGIAAAGVAATGIAATGIAATGIAATGS